MQIRGCPLLLALFSQIFIRSVFAASRPWHHICIIGNTQSTANATRSHKMWSNAYPSFWYRWGSPSHESIESLPPNLHFIEPSNIANGSVSMTWAQGISFLFNTVKQSYDCEYFFTHDDDLYFSLAPTQQTTTSNSSTTSIASTLSNILFQYQPAVAGFPWAYGDRTYAGMKSQAKVQAQHPSVNVLTGFDSGMILYHKSIASLFIPYSPRGEGGFHGNWSLCAHFISLFAPHTFQGAAIRINAIQYENRVSISNVPVRERKRVHKKDSSHKQQGLTVHAESRHPYEFTWNRGYMQFLTAGLWNRELRWGREMRAMDLAWDLEIMPSAETFSAEGIRSGGQKHRSFDKWDTLHRLADFYDLSYASLSKNAWIRDNFMHAELVHFMEKRHEDGMDFSFSVHLFTQGSNSTAFSALWTSISRATKVSNPVHIHIHFDYQERSHETPLENLMRLQGLSSKHGPVSVHVSTRKKGPVQSMLGARSSTDPKEYAIFIPRETTRVSRHIFQYSKQMTRTYLHSPLRHSSCIGVSLHPAKGDQSVALGDRSSLVLAQIPPQDGLIVSTLAWTRFVSWFTSLSVDFDPMVYEGFSNEWSADERWAQVLDENGDNHGVLLDLDTIEGEESISFWRQATGLQFQLATDNLNLSSAQDDDSVITGLSRSVLYPHTKQLPALNSPDLSILNHQLHAVKGISSLKKYSRRSRQIDRCALVLYVEDRTRTSAVRIQYYQSHPLISSIQVSWNSRENSSLLHEPMPNVTFSTPFRIIEPTKNQPLHRFSQHILSPEVIKESAYVVNLDEDTDLHHEDLTGVIRTFQKMKQYNQIVAVTHPIVRYTDPQRFGAAVFHVDHLKGFNSFIQKNTHVGLGEVGRCVDAVFVSYMERKFPGVKPLVIHVAKRVANMDGYSQDDAHLFHQDISCKKHLLEWQ
ncbi:hypothetical protein CcCBS67573_g04801 [Chytriomyces confervae]|uniref:Glycosyl transferase 64 domain-containing protein n=1 Tax=Chytriomyces confervae TaxID=246404 RepID=A0A507FC62_9FUNG|nr:hypothetical protein CcCBS67573_g04801 [Chytriomyces confervae]